MIPRNRRQPSFFRWNITISRPLFRWLGCWMGVGAGLACDALSRAAWGSGAIRTVQDRDSAGGDDGCRSYRIPGLAVSNAGTLIACFDVRWDGPQDLPANIDVGVMRSSDGGRTWGPMIIAIDYDQQVPGSAGNGVGDAAILVDPSSGHIFLAALWSLGDNGWKGSGPGMQPHETGQLVISVSTDDGVTWQPPRSITPQVKQADWRLCFQGPGAGIVLRDGTLVFPAQFKDSQDKPSSCFIFSTDGGQRWRISPPAIPGIPPTSESQLVQLADDRLLMTMPMSRVVPAAVGLLELHCNWPTGSGVRTGRP